MLQCCHPTPPQTDSVKVSDILSHSSDNTDMIIPSIESNKNVGIPQKTTMSTDSDMMQQRKIWWKNPNLP